MKKYLALLFVFILLAGCGPQRITTGTATTDLPLLTVDAEGQVEVNPDQLQLRLAVVTEAQEAGMALEQNNLRMTAVMQMLQGIGISADELATGQFRITPQWSRPPRPTPANWQREIIGYRVDNELLVTTGQVELAGKLLGLAQQAGANQIGGLQFGLADPTAAQQEAIRIATQKAMRKAQAMAEAAGVKLATVQSMRLNGGGGSMQPRLMLAEARSASADTVPVASGKVEIAATVSLTYRIEPTN
ncbi:hypothetical protein SAMN02745165_01416 [Malonomonas rubra DSM 5091]|uniref:DUF541 domain-containing protein n=1 Tax=Malonomonas rubra DSM 5091 TaxID=1122189 RepID=A0A1M6G571_MALRU|nr:SIMPL domain-containing protein [Malonomonas rubra]SHJ05138.1 hypothetical protein SAMN02745165_01416 [Malonomonas rubra DSM 5091]